MGLINNKLRQSNFLRGSYLLKASVVFYQQLQSVVVHMREGSSEFSPGGSRKILVVHKDRG
jgi:hypothetical protein